MRNVTGSESQVVELSIQQIKVDSIKHLICPHSIFSTQPQNDSVKCVYVHFSAQILLVDSHFTQRGKKNLRSLQDFQVLIRYSICSSTTSLFPAIDSLLFLIERIYDSTSGLLHLLFPLLGMFFPRISSWVLTPFQKNLCSKVTFWGELLWPSNIKGSP